MAIRILTGDVFEQLAQLEADSFDMAVTSPPYWGLRDYGVAGQLGLEPTLGEHLDVMVRVFREVRRVLKPEGTLWLSYGDCYATSPNGRSAADTKLLSDDDRTFRDKPFSTVGPIYEQQPDSRQAARRGRTGNLGNGGIQGQNLPGGRVVAGGYLKPKDLCLVPNRLAQALQEPFYTGTITRVEDRVWLACLIDGEGSIFIGKQPEGHPTGRDMKSKRSFAGFSAGLTISNTNRALLERCVTITGVGSVSTIDGGEKRRDHHVWRIGNAKALSVLREVYPHLVAKKHEARLALGCPASGALAERCYSGLKNLHHGRDPEVDMPPPASLFEQGWWVRSEIIWGKPNPMPDSAGKYRPSTAHEKIWMLAKSAKYFYDPEAVAQAVSERTNPRVAKSATAGKQAETAASAAAVGASSGRRMAGFNERWVARQAGVTPKSAAEDTNVRAKGSFHASTTGAVETRYLRNYEPAPLEVWEIASQAFPEAHFATFPPELARRCIEAACPPGGHVLDPFGGAGTTGLVADQLRRNATLIELNPEYVEIARRRVWRDGALFDGWDWSDDPAA